MSQRFKLVEYEDAGPEVKLIYEETMKEMGIPFVLNWFKCQGNNPTVLRGNWEKLRNTMLRGSVPFVLKQLIIYNISNLKGCDYCAQAHGIIADSLGKTLTGENDLRLTNNLDSSYIPSSYRKAISIVTRCALAPRSTTDEDFEELRDEGFSLEEVQELMALADLTNMVNTIADISGIKIDNELMEPK
ncbi:carboxymuconolactone decarboxylase family protein [Mucilaginibacter defluvii]|uniref:AhpD family alkylhydroperoxidase n=1 Tax=Mucilaginibacter defluvii TaxID=1196019 RepID=A0ABP9FX65_9SPHI